MTKLSIPTQRYLQRMVSLSRTESKDETLARIHVDYIASRVATLYEKLRQVIDYQEEHLLRKNAIERILKRRLMLSRDSKEIAEPLIFELIRGGYFPNDRIPEQKIKEIQEVLEKYIFLLENIPSNLKGSQRNLISQWIQGLAACEIEEIISPSLKEMALLEYMTEVMKERIKVINQISEKDKNIQIMIACQRNLLKSDKTLISFRLFKLHLPNWPKPSTEKLLELSQKIFILKKKIDREISNPVGKKISQTISRYTAPFLIIGDVVSEDPTQTLKIFEDPEALEQNLLQSYNKRFKDCRAKIKRSGARSVLSIFLSKVALAFLIEIPFDIYITQKFAMPALAINLVFPPFLMFLIVSSIKPPKIESAPKIVMQTIKVIKWSEKPETYEIKLGEKRSRILSAILALIFLIISGIVFGLMVYLLLKIQFSILSIIIFFIFFCLIAFSGIKTHKFAKELKIEQEQDGWIAFLADLFFLPFVRAGKYLSGQLQKYNIFILLLNLFFEAPLQTFFEFLEAWRGYLKEKREETE